MAGNHLALADGQELFCLSLSDLIDWVQIGRISLKEVSQRNVKSIKDTILKNLDTHKMFFSILVGHVEEGDLLHNEGDISIIDGSYDVKACVQLYQNALKAIQGNDEHEKKKAIVVLGFFENTMIGIQLHKGLTLEQKHQYYLDQHSVKKKTSIRKWEFHYGEKDIKSRNDNIKTPGGKSGRQPQGFDNKLGIPTLG
jgi:hypothetical protein